MSKNIKLKPGDKIFYAIYDVVFPDESHVSSDEVLILEKKAYMLIITVNLQNFIAMMKSGNQFFLQRKKHKKNYYV